MTVVAAQDFIDQTREEIQTYYDSRKLSWHQCDRGTSLRAFFDQWDTILEDIDLDSPRETYVPSFRAVRKLEELFEEPD